MRKQHKKTDTYLVRGGRDGLCRFCRDGDLFEGIEKRYSATLPAVVRGFGIQPYPEWRLRVDRKRLAGRPLLRGRSRLGRRAGREILCPPLLRFRCAGLGRPREYA